MFILMAASLSMGLSSLSDLHEDPEEDGFLQGAKPAGQKMGSIGGRFGLWDMKDAEGSGMFSELYLDAPRPSQRSRPLLRDEIDYGTRVW